MSFDRWLLDAARYYCRKLKKEFSAIISRSSLSVTVLAFIVHLHTQIQIIVFGDSVPLQTLSSAEKVGLLVPRMVFTNLCVECHVDDRQKSRDISIMILSYQSE